MHLFESSTVHFHTLYSPTVLGRDLQFRRVTYPCVAASLPPWQLGQAPADACNSSVEKAGTENGWMDDFWGTSISLWLIACILSRYSAFFLGQISAPSPWNGWIDVWLDGQMKRCIQQRSDLSISRTIFVLWFLLLLFLFICIYNVPFFPGAYVSQRCHEHLCVCAWYNITLVAHYFNKLRLVSRWQIICPGKQILWPLISQPPSSCRSLLCGI